VEAYHQKIGASNGKFFRNMSFNYSCSEDGLTSASDQKKTIQCEFKSEPETYYIPGVVSDIEHPEITTKIHEANHFIVFKNKYIPSYVDLFKMYSDVYCCNCEKRKDELLKLLADLDSRLDMWEKSKEYVPVVLPGFTHPSSVKKQPVIDYGGSVGSVNSVVNAVAEQMETDCVL
jgi:hypothetical protein